MHASMLGIEVPRLERRGYQTHADVNRVGMSPRFFLNVVTQPFQ